jgi:hypothetical protein
MTKRDAIKNEVAALYKEGAELAVSFQKKEEKQFHYDYQAWFTKAVRTVETLASDRAPEFKSYYHIDPKRKSLGYGTFVIQDYMKGVVPSSYHHPDFDTRGEVMKCFLNQLTILHSVNGRIDAVLANIEGELFAELQDNEIAVSRQLAKVSLRAAGALVGVVIEGHLQKVAAARGTPIAKKNPTIADLNDPLKAASVIDTPTWRRISYLADLRNLCSHKKDVEPTKDQVEELIAGAEWLTKNVF